MCLLSCVLVIYLAEVVFSNSVCARSAVVRAIIDRVIVIGKCHFLIAYVTTANNWVCQESRQGCGC